MALRSARQVCSCNIRRHTPAQEIPLERRCYGTPERDKTEKRVKRFNNVNIAPE